MVDFPSPDAEPRNGAPTDGRAGDDLGLELDAALATALANWRDDEPSAPDDAHDLEPSRASRPASRVHDLDDDVADELAAHARARVRDLLLAGASRDRAIAAAIEELGRSDDLAVRLRAARGFPRRRRLMHVFTATVGAGLLGTGIIMGGHAGLTGTGGPPSATYETPASTAASVAGDAVLASGADDEVELGDALELVAGSLDLGVLVDWSRLEDFGMARDHEVALPPAGTPVARTLESLASQVEHGLGMPVVWDERDGLLELLLREDLDRRTTSLVAYDLQTILDAMSQRHGLGSDPAAARVVSLVTSMASADDWDVRGGDLASANVVGSRMFVSAPARIHDQVAWMLGQLEPAADAGAAARFEAPLDGPYEVGHLVRVRIADFLTQNAWTEIDRRIQPDGTINLPTVGAITVVGLHVGEIETVVTEAVAEHVQNPLVVVLGPDERLVTNAR